MKAFQGIVRRKGTQEWQPVLHSGQHFYADQNGVGQLKQMLQMMAMHFQFNEYSIQEVSL